MKRARPVLKILLWSAVLAVLVALIAAGVHTNVTLRSVEKNLPSTLFEQLHDLALVNEDPIHPRRMTIVGDFFVRGGIHTVVTAGHEAPRPRK